MNIKEKFEAERSRVYRREPTRETSELEVMIDRTEAALTKAAEKFLYESLIPEILYDVVNQNIVSEPQGLLGVYRGSERKRKNPLFTFSWGKLDEGFSPLEYDGKFHIAFEVDPIKSVVVVISKGKEVEIAEEDLQNRELCESVLVEALLDPIPAVYKNPWVEPTEF